MEIDAETKRRLSEYIITQMLNVLRFLLNVNEIVDSDTKTFDEVRIDTCNCFKQYYPKYIPNFNCLWDIIFNFLSWNYKRVSYTPIFSAYCRSNNIATKKDLYIKMSDELERWVDTIDRFEDLVIIAIGMTQKCDIWGAFIKYGYPPKKTTKFYRDILDILRANNFENIDWSPHGFKPYKPIKTKYDDPHQQVFYKHIMIQLSMMQSWFSIKMTTNAVCTELSELIYAMFDVEIPVRLLDENIELNNIEIHNIDQIIEYLESKIPQYPDEIKDHLSILASIDIYINPENKHTMTKLAKMAELSKYNLRHLPIYSIIHGFGGATPLEDIPLEQIPEYYARLTQSYSGTHTKAARR